jgi:hypothetical protein
MTNALLLLPALGCVAMMGACGWMMWRMGTRDRQPRNDAGD